MAIRPLNSVNGFSVGDTGNVVVYANLDIVGNTITADNNLIGNGLNVNGISNLSGIANVRISGGSSGQAIVTDGTGNLSFSTISSDSAAPMPYYIPVGNTSTVPEYYQGLFSQTIEIDGTFEVDGVLIQVTDTVDASNLQVLYSDNGTPTGNSGFTFDPASGNLTLPGNITISGNVFPNANITYDLGSNTHRWKDLWLANSTIYIGNGTISADANGAISLVNGLGGELIVAGNATITSIDNGNSNISITANGNIVTSVAGNIGIFTVTGTGANTFGTFSVSGNATVGAILTDNYYYSNGSPLDIAGSPAGSNTQVQFNNAGDFGASSNFTFDIATNVLSINGNISANNANLGNLASSNYLVSNSGCVMVGTGAIAVIGNTGGIFNSAITDINLGLVSNITMGSNVGTVTIRNDLDVANVLDAPSITVGDLYSRRSSIPITSPNTVIDTFPVSFFRSAKYTIRVGDDTGYQAIEVLLVHNDINSIITVYGSLSTTQIDLVTLTTGINASNVELRATAINANTTINLMGTYVPD